MAVHAYCDIPNAYGLGVGNGIKALRHVGVCYANNRDDLTLKTHVSRISLYSLMVCCVLLFTMPVMAVKQLPTGTSTYNICSNVPPQILDFYETGYSIGDIEGRIRTSVSGTYWKLQYEMDYLPETRQIVLVDEVQNLFASGWIRANHCVNPQSYWRQYLDVVIWPVLLAKEVPVGFGPKTNGEPPLMCEFDINPSNGNNFQEQNDITPRELSSLTFDRFYNSNSAVENGEFGFGWSHTFSSRLYSFNNGSEVSVSRPDGKTFYYRASVSGWEADPDVKLNLQPLTDEDGIQNGWRIKDERDVAEEYSLDGRLKRVFDESGGLQELSYDQDDRLESVVTDRGDSLHFTYDSDSRVNVITDHADNHWSYTYDTLSRLAGVEYPDGSIKSYHYEESQNPNVLTGITNENGVRTHTWGYNDAGHAVISQGFNESSQIALVYNADGSTTVTNPLGKKTTYFFETIHDVRRIVRIEGHPTDNCGSSNKAYSYDSNGNLASKTDWQGNVTTYVHDNRGLELSRTEADGTPDARTIITEWHPIFRKPVRIVEPGKITHFVYDDNGQLLTRTEQSSQ